MSSPLQVWTCHPNNNPDICWWIFHLKKNSILETIEDGKEKIHRGAWLFYDSEIEEWRIFNPQDYPITEEWQPADYEQLMKYWQEQFSSTSPFPYTDIAERKLRVWTHYPPINQRVPGKLEYKEEEFDSQKTPDSEGEKEILYWIFNLKKKIRFQRMHKDGHLEWVEGNWIVFNPSEEKWFKLGEKGFSVTDKSCSRVEYNRLIAEWEKGMFAKLTPPRKPAFALIDVAEDT